MTRALALCGLLLCSCSTAVEHAELRDASELRADFNSAGQSTRVVVLLSPT
jgi:hypothetical protein